MSLRDDLLNDKNDSSAEDYLHSINQPLPTPPVYGVNAPKPTSVVQQNIVPDNSPTIAERNKKGESLISILEAYNKPQDFQEQFRQAEKERKIAAFTDMIGAGGNILTALLGGRRFGNQPSAVGLVNDKIEKLKDLKRQYDVDYNNKRLDAAYKQYMLDHKDALDADKVKRETAQQQFRNNLLQEQFDYQKKRNAVMDERWGKEFAARQENNQTTQALNWYRAKTDQTYKQDKAQMEQLKVEIRKAWGNVKSPNDVEYILGTDGQKIAVPKSIMKGLVNYLYPRMGEKIDANPEVYDGIKFTGVKTGRDNNKYSNKEAIVKSLLQYFPELQDEADSIIKSAVPHSLLPFSISQNQSTGSLLPK